MNIFILFIYTIIMNQIIEYPNKLIEYLNHDEVLKSNVNSNKRKGAIFFKCYFFLSILILSIALIYYFSKIYTLSKNEKISKQLINNYDISMLYQNTSSNTSNLALDDNSFSVIGLLEIEKIDLKYPILSNATEYLLQIAPCRFYGPMASEVRKSMYRFSQL